MITVTVFSGPDEGGVFRLKADEDRWLIGRNHGQISLRDSKVSRRHAELYCKDGGWWIKDLGSTNGTTINGRRVVGPKQLKDGDRAQIGRNTLAFDIASDADIAQKTDAQVEDHSAPPSHAEALASTDESLTVAADDAALEPIGRTTEPVVEQLFEYVKQIADRPENTTDLTPLMDVIDTRLGNLDRLVNPILKRLDDVTELMQQFNARLDAQAAETAKVAAERDQLAGQVAELRARQQTVNASANLQARLMTLAEELDSLKKSMAAAGKDGHDARDPAMQFPRLGEAV